jgi:anti-sigma28 factor (negative regulator of flagellin synthesis)
MGISINGPNHGYLNAVSSSSMDPREVTRSNKNQKFDQILITTTEQQIEEKKAAEDMKIVEEAKNRIRLELAGSVSQEKLDALKEAVSTGSYQVDVRAVVDKILLQKG